MPRVMFHRQSSRQVSMNLDYTCPLGFNAAASVLFILTLFIVNKAR